MNEKLILLKERNVLWKEKGILCKQIRLQNKKTQLEIAEILGVSRGYINAMECGRASANPALLIKYWNDKGYKL